MTRLSAEMTQTARDLHLSAIAYQVGQLLADAAELYGQERPTDPREQGKMLVRMQDGQTAEKAARASEWAVDASIKGALDTVAEAWEDHTQAAFLRMRLADVLTELSGTGELATTVYWMAARQPERFCPCGQSLGTSAQMDRGTCDRCAERAS